MKAESEPDDPRRCAVCHRTEAEVELQLPRHPPRTRPDMRVCVDDHGCYRIWAARERRQAASRYQQLYIALVDEGFSEEQALRILKHVLEIAARRDEDNQ